MAIRRVLGHLVRSEGQSMMAACYSTDLYCDAETHSGKNSDTNRMPQTFTGRSKTQTLRKAREEGWRIGKRHICPECVKLGAK